MAALNDAICPQVVGRNYDPLNPKFFIDYLNLLLKFRSSINNQKARHAISLDKLVLDKILDCFRVEPSYYCSFQPSHQVVAAFNKVPLPLISWYMLAIKVHLLHRPQGQGGSLHCFLIPSRGLCLTIRVGDDCLYNFSVHPRPVVALLEASVGYLPATVAILLVGCFNEFLAFFRSIHYTVHLISIQEGLLEQSLVQEVFSTPLSKVEGLLSSQAVQHGKVMQVACDLLGLLTLGLIRVQRFLQFIKGNLGVDKLINVTCFVSLTYSLFYNRKAQQGVYNYIVLAFNILNFKVKHAYPGNLAVNQGPQQIKHGTLKLVHQDLGVGLKNKVNAIQVAPQFFKGIEDTMALLLHCVVLGFSVIPSITFKSTEKAPFTSFLDKDRSLTYNASIYS